MKKKNAIRDPSAPCEEPEKKLKHRPDNLLESTKNETEYALRVNEEQLGLAIANSPIPVIMHAEDGQILQISRTWTELTGYRIEDIRRFDQWVSSAVYGEGADEVRDYMKKLFSYSGNRRVEFDIRTKTDDTRRWSFNTSAPGILADGRRFIIGMA